MGMSVEEVRRWRPGTLSAMADDTTVKAHDYETATTAGFTPLRELAESWIGQASDAAAARVAREQKAVTYTTESIMQLRDALDNGAGELTAAKNRVLDVVDSIESSGCKLVDGTTVETTTSFGPTDDHPLIAKQVVQKLAWELTDALREAERTDARVAREIEAAVKAMTAQARAPYSRGGVSRPMLPLPRTWGRTPSRCPAIRQRWRSCGRGSPTRTRRRCSRSTPTSATTTASRATSATSTTASTWTR